MVRKFREKRGIKKGKVGERRTKREREKEEEI
jgi:hypothetical protein